eukprot:1297991-Rhodomonas_salina.2
MGGGQGYPGTAVGGTRQAQPAGYGETRLHPNDREHFPCRADGMHSDQRGMTESSLSYQQGTDEADLHPMSELDSTLGS